MALRQALLRAPKSVRSRPARMRAQSAPAAGVGAVATGASAEPLKEDQWSLEWGGPTPAAQSPSPFEKATTRTLSNPQGEARNSHARTPHHMLNGSITPNAMHFSINHAGIPNIDPAQHKLVIHGLSLIHI